VDSLFARGAAGRAICTSSTVYMVKAIMNGRTDEIVDLAKSNLWR
jgi:hypothetical protein